MADATVHATCVVVGEAGILIRGPSGAGKSTLARRLVFAAAALGRFGRLVCDDRVRVEARGRRLVARAVPAIAGRIETRGVAIATVPFEGAAVLRLVVDLLADAPERLPDEAEGSTTIAGVVLPRLALPLGEELAQVVLWRLDNLDGGRMTDV